jgi:hypothetical protein
MFQSSWGNQGQQQQQNPQGAFGTPNTFGNNPGTSSEYTILHLNRSINYSFSFWVYWLRAAAVAAAATSSESHVWKPPCSLFNGAVGRFWYVSINPVQLPLSHFYSKARLPIQVLVLSVRISHRKDSARSQGALARSEAPQIHLGNLAIHRAQGQAFSVNRPLRTQVQDLEVQMLLVQINLQLLYSVLPQQVCRSY